jgi:hypothetical protein
MDQTELALSGQRGRGRGRLMNGACPGRFSCGEIVPVMSPFSCLDLSMSLESAISQRLLSPLLLLSLLLSIERLFSFTDMCENLF